MYSGLYINSKIETKVCPKLSVSLLFKSKHLTECMLLMCPTFTVCLAVPKSTFVWFGLVLFSGRIPSPSVSLMLLSVAGETKGDTNLQ